MEVDVELHIQIASHRGNNLHYAEDRRLSGRPVKRSISIFTGK
jgi:hypothetical protein